MESINIFGENRFETYTKTRKACRGIVISNGMILLTYEVNTDQWFINEGRLTTIENFENLHYSNDPASYQTVRYPYHS